MFPLPYSLKNAPFSSQLGVGGCVISAQKCCAPAHHSFKSAAGYWRLRYKYPNNVAFRHSFISSLQLKENAFKKSSLRKNTFFYGSPFNVIKRHKSCFKCQLPIFTEKGQIFISCLSVTVGGFCGEKKRLTLAHYYFSIFLSDRLQCRYLHFAHCQPMPKNASRQVLRNANWRNFRSVITLIIAARPEKRGLGSRNH